MLPALSRSACRSQGVPEALWQCLTCLTMWCVQSFLTLYASAAKELVGLLGQCPQAEPTLEDPHGAFITPAELRIQRLVRPTTLSRLLRLWPLIHAYQEQSVLAKQRVIRSAPLSQFWQSGLEQGSIS